ncbi:MAG: glycosyltransferase [Pseudomonadales bacterium]
MSTQKIILVLGMHRSGTSVLARAVESVGAELGTNLMPPVEGNNPRGFFEDLQINRVCDQVLARLGSRWDSFGADSAEEQTCGEIEDLLAAAADVLSQKLEESERFCFKNPRVAVLLPFWKEVFARKGIEPRYVVSVRSPQSVAQSLLTRDGIQASAGVLLWLQHYMMILRHTEADSRIFVSYDRLLESPGEEIDRIAGHLSDLSPGPSSESRRRFTDDFLDRDLRHHAAAGLREKKSDEMPPIVLAVHRLLMDLALLKLADGSAGYQRRFVRAARVMNELGPALRLLGRMQSTTLAVRTENAKIKELLGGQLPVGATQKSVAEHLKPLSVGITSIAERIDQVFESVDLLKQRDADQLAQFRQAAESAARMQAEAQRLASELRAAEQTRAGLALRVEELEADVGRGVDRVAALQEDLETATRTTAEYQDEIRKLGQSLSRRETDLAQRDAIIRVFENSRSFRLTRPLRAIRRSGAETWGLGLRPAASRLARSAWLAIPFPAGAKSRAKSVLFRSSGRLFSWSKAYKDWAAHEEYHGRRRPSAIPPEGAPTRPRQAGSSAAGVVERKDFKDEGASFRSEEQLWSGKSGLLERFGEQGPILHDTPPASVREYATSVVSSTRLKVSVIIPTWNRETTIVRAIDSVLSQSLAPAEILVSDDGSEDSTRELVRERYAGEIAAGQVVLIENEHRGVSAARNAGMRLATGDVFAYLDSDNAWRPDFLLMVVAALEESDEIAAVYAGLQSHDLGEDSRRVRASHFDRNRLLEGNYIDLNIFAHRRVIYDLCGGFDESLTRLVDWELIIRFTKHYTPLFLPFVAVDYYLDASNLSNITHTVGLERNRARVLDRHFSERVSRGLEQLRIAYFVYDFPARSQTFVFNEIRWLVSCGYDVKVYYAVPVDESAELDFPIEAYQVRDAQELAALFVEHQRNLCHSHFAFPGVALFVRPACEASAVYFTFMPHAVDIFHHRNRERNQIASVANDPRCLKVLVYGDFHREFLAQQGVPREKIAYSFQAVDLKKLDTLRSNRSRSPRGPMHGIAIARFIQKKGIEYLLDALAHLEDLDIHVTLYGYGPLEADYRKRVEELGLASVRFGGVIEGRDELTAAYAGADFLVSPCVEADDGDTDGFPTVILEAISAGVPVVSTAISAIPDYVRDGIEGIVVKPADALDLAAGLRRLFGMSAPRRDALVRRAGKLLKHRIGTAKTMRRLLDIWEGYTLEVLLVTYNTEGYDDREETYEIVRRILSHTTTQFTLTVVDNASDQDFWDGLVELCRGRSDVRLLRQRRNLLCGPATNVALRAGREEYLIYVCSKEGFVKDHGWERSLLSYMRSNPEVPMAGHLSVLPRFAYGRELPEHPDFSRFRGGAYALENPDRLFRHVQGGVFIADRKALQSVGGYNDLVPQANMDVEMSYWMEANGYRLGEIAEVASITTKTLPPLTAVLSENTVVAHPLSLASVARLDAMRRKTVDACNVCGALCDRGADSESLFSPEGLCRECGVTPFGRSIFRALASHFQIHRNCSVAILSKDGRLAAAVGERMFAEVSHFESTDEFVASLESGDLACDCMIVDGDMAPEPARGDLLEVAAGGLARDGAMLYVSEQAATTACPVGQFGAAAGSAESGVSLGAKRFSIEFLDDMSERLNLDWRPLVKLQSAG